MPGASQTLVAAAWLGGMPLLFLTLAALGWRHDRLSAAWLAVSGVGFVLQVSAVLRGWPSQMLSPMAVAGLAALALASFAFRLWRDRRLAHVRTTAESLAVLAIGAVLLFALLSLPSL